MNVQEQIKNILPASLNQNAVTCKRCQHVNYGSTTVKTAKIKLLLILTIGYGFHTIKYTNGTIREFFQLGLIENNNY